MKTLTQPLAVAPHSFLALLGMALLGLALLALALPGLARAQYLDVQVRDLDTGHYLDHHPHRGQLHVAGEPGHRYAVVLRNLTGGRVLAVLSVDGVNAISGQTAGTDQAGYVLGPWQQTEIRGWRKNLSEIAEFEFTALPDSYAARTGRPRNVGVIGVAVFREAVPAPYHPPVISPRERADLPLGGARANADAVAAAPPAKAQADAEAYGSRRAEAAPEARQSLGTGHGQRRWDAARTTQFERASRHPDQVLAVYYDSYRALVARGVVPRPHRHRWQEPQAFPIGFVPDPY